MFWFLLHLRRVQKPYHAPRGDGQPRVWENHEKVSKKVFGMIILSIQIIFWRHKILPLQSSCSLWATSFTAKKLRSIVYCSCINDFRPNSIIFYMKSFSPWILRYAITRSRYCLDKIRTFLFKWVLTSCKLSSYSLE